MIEDYIRELQSYLKKLEPIEQDEAIEFYREYILDGQFSDRKAIEKELGTPRQLARKIIAQNSLSSEANANQTTSFPQKTKHDLKAIWRILGGLAAIPIGIPLMMLLLACLLVVLLVAAIVTLISIGLIGGSIWIIVLILPFLFSADWAVGLFYLGIALIVLSLVLLLEPLDIRLFRWLINSVAQLTRLTSRHFFPHPKKQFDDQKEMDQGDY